MTLDLKEVKSLEELRIANWLVLNRVKYEYEKSFEHDVATETKRQYYPDFYYPEADAYHEHFALDENGSPPEFMKDYLESANWKRMIHEKCGTELFETYSADFNSDEIFSKLKEELESRGVSIQPLSKNELDAKVKESYSIKNDVEIFETFLRHFKANNLTIAEINEQSKKLTDQYRVRIFLKVFEKLYAKYQELLRNNR